MAMEGEEIMSLLPLSNDTSSDQDFEEFKARAKEMNVDGFDCYAGRHWIYPINRDIRDYQYCIVYQALFNNTLVVLPTGLGKTLIAAVVMYNFYLWYPRCKIVFMAPTRPLVKQQMEACFDIVGIPREDIVELTGHTPPWKRQEEWATKRLFFLTPQVMQNDLFLNDYCPAESIKCIVVDEAHKATGGYAYTRVVEEVYKRTKDFRVLALSATPGKDLMHIRQVLKNLLISKIEYRSEESMDVQKYTHRRKCETIVVQLDEEVSFYRGRLLQIIEENLKTLLKRKAIPNYDLNRLSAYSFMMQRRLYAAGQHNIPQGLIGANMFTFSIVSSLVGALDLLTNHSLRCFYNRVKGTNHEDDEDSPSGKSKNKKKFQLSKIMKNNKILQEMMEDLKKKFEPDGNVTLDGDPESGSVYTVPGHPKLIKLEEIVLNHFKVEGMDTRIMIFTSFRDSVEEITCLLRQHEPNIRPVQFVGQSSVKRRGFSQKQQLEVINRFRDGEFNVLIATCVAEEGLDIGNVDLIICYDASKSPIRLVQRMGRTGRAREGKIIVLVSAGGEERAYNDSVYNKKRVATNLLSGIKPEDLFQENVRLYPKGLKPLCRKLYLGMRPGKPENGQSDDGDSGGDNDRENKGNSVKSEKKRRKDLSVTKKRSSSTTKGSSSARKITGSTRSSTGDGGNTSTRKRKNRFIVEDDFADEDNFIDDDCVSDDGLQEKIKTKKRLTLETPVSKGEKKRKRKSHNKGNPKEDINGDEESINSFGNTVINETVSRNESVSSFSFDDIPLDIFDENLSEEENGQSVKGTLDSVSESSSPETKRVKLGQAGDGEQDNQRNEGVNQFEENVESQSEPKDDNDDEPIYGSPDEPSPDPFPSPSLSSKSSLSSSSPPADHVTQIESLFVPMKLKNLPDQSVPVKKSKWAEFDSDDSLDYNPLEESPRKRKSFTLSSKA